MKNIDASVRNDAMNCFVCGTNNAIGLKIEFILSEKGCTGNFTPKKEHSGFDNVTHGGIVFSILDDAMANWFYLQGASGFTAKSEIRYRNAMPIGVAVAIKCQFVKKKGKLVQLQSHASDMVSNMVYAESEASFILTDEGNLKI